MSVATKWLKLESRGIHYKVALYPSSLVIVFDDDIQGGPSIWRSQNRVHERYREICDNKNPNVT